MSKNNVQKHTPGPITVKRDTLPWVGYYLYDKDNNCIGGTALENETDRENANLWASAPDLLAERARLRASNAELLEALKFLLLEACKILASLNEETIEECTDHFGKTGSTVTVYQFNSVQYDTLVEALKKASAAIENATKEQK